ncbi:MAG: cyclic nucleotide-binding domain-containing protein [Mariprofundaceae bacterium]|nr:cyclic nucleotide-binding domain-containing protein [Mariprofundaceae bacterium]
MSIESNQKLALDAIKQGDYPAALLAFTALVKLEPRNMEFCLMAAEIAEKEEKKDLAAKFYAHAARFYVSLNNIGQAVVMMKHYHRIHPHEKRLCRQLFDCCKNCNRDDDSPCLPLLPVNDKIRLSLHNHDLFSWISDHAFNALLPDVEIQTFEDGDVITRDGEKAEALYLIAQGGVLPRVVESEETHELSIIHEGGICGEVPFMTGGQYRTADLIAVEKTMLVLIPYTAMKALIQTYPKVGASLDAFYQKHVLERQLACTPFFDILQEDERKAISQKLQTIHFKAGDVLFSEDASEPLDVFIVRSGWLSVNVCIQGQESLIYTAKTSHVLGDTGILAKKRHFTVRAISDVVAMQWLADDYQRCYDQHEELRHRVADRMIAYQEAISELRLGNDSTFVEVDINNRSLFRDIYR